VRSDRDPFGRSLLHYAAMADDVEAVERLVAAGEDVDLGDHQGFTPMHFAAQQGALDAVRVLVRHGARVDEVNRFGNTPLFVAVFTSSGDGQMIALLREHGADPFHANAAGQTPIGLARLIANYDVKRYFADLPDQ
jgi:uncharacterized protein